MGEKIEGGEIRRRVDISAAFCYTVKKKGVAAMPMIRPISDLRDNVNEISDFCRQTRQPVYLTRNGTGDMVMISIAEYERQQALLDLYGKLAVAEKEIADGAKGEDFLTVARQLRERVHGTEL